MDLANPAANGTVLQAHGQRIRDILETWIAVAEFRNVIAMGNFAPVIKETVGNALLAKESELLGEVGRLLLLVCLLNPMHVADSNASGSVAGEDSTDPRQYGGENVKQTEESVENAKAEDPAPTMPVGMEDEEDSDHEGHVANQHNDIENRAASSVIMQKQTQVPKVKCTLAGTSRVIKKKTSRQRGTLKKPPLKKISFEACCKTLVEMAREGSKKCPYCCKPPTDATDLVRHLLRHVNDWQYYPYRCPDARCTYAAFWVSKIREHFTSNVHNGIWTDETAKHATWTESIVRMAKWRELFNK
ncbi:hypothetical protein AAVH_35584 [Aphelenchoides avenae]|nr:hypothetical protein AAVH_35584 [Aphelenchus avenae]